MNRWMKKFTWTMIWFPRFPTGMDDHKEQEPERYHVNIQETKVENVGKINAYLLEEFTGCWQ
jgi:hypothetical protein